MGEYKTVTLIQAGGTTSLLATHCHHPLSLTAFPQSPAFFHFPLLPLESICSEMLGGRQEYIEQYLRMSFFFLICEQYHTPREEADMGHGRKTDMLV